MGLARFIIVLALFSYESKVLKGQYTMEMTKPYGQFPFGTQVNLTVSDVTEEPVAVKAIKDYLTRAAAEDYETWFWIAMPILVLLIVGLIGVNIYM